MHRWKTAYQWADIPKEGTAIQRRGWTEINQELFDPNVNIHDKLFTYHDDFYDDLFIYDLQSGEQIWVTVQSGSK